MIKDYGTYKGGKEMKDTQKTIQEIGHLKSILNLLELRLRYFKDGNLSDREALRKAIDWVSVGYVSSLMAMLSEEDRFQRWQAFTTAKYKKLK